MARGDPQVNFRIPAALRDRLELASKESGRTLTAELVQRLETSFEPSIRQADLRTNLHGVVQSIIASAVSELDIDDLVDEMVQKVRKRVTKMAGSSFAVRLTDEPSAAD